MSPAPVAAVITIAALALGVPVIVGRESRASLENLDALCFRSERERPKNAPDGVPMDGLYLTRDGGETVERLVDESRDVVHFAVHPRGARLAFVCDPNDTEMFELHVLDLASGEEERVGSGITFGPTWSRDGERLAYMDHADGWYIRLTEPDLVVERPPQDQVGGDGAPSWFPDGRRIAFQSNRDERLELYAADTTSGSVQRLTNTPQSETLPRVSPDGKWILFEREQGLWLLPSEDGEARRLTKKDVESEDGAWSPDSRRIACVTRSNDNTDLYVLTLDDDDPRRLTRHAATDHSPAWSPDGARIAFVSERDGNEEIYTIASDGTDLRRVTRHPGPDRSPAWLP